MKDQIIRIRMYRVGFGDCFLLSIPAAKDQNTDRQQHILIDCGVHSRGDIGTIEKVVDNIGEVTDRKLAVIIATHAHQDHISGFSKFGDIFTKFKIREIWLPWTWNEKDKEALDIQKRQIALTQQLFQHFHAQGLAGNQDAIFTIENLNLRENSHAIDLLKSGFGDYKTKIRYLRVGDSLTPKDISIAGLLVNILGPPKSEEFLRQMNPPRSQRYLQMIGNKVQITNTIEPFLPRWKIDSKVIPMRLDIKEEEEMQNMTRISPDDLAFALDQLEIMRA